MDSTLDDLIRRFRAGDEAAARDLFERFSERMLAVARRHLSGASNRAALDSEGVVQEGFRSFFSALGKPEFDPRKGSIGGLLATIVARKALARRRRSGEVPFSPEDLATLQDATTVLLDGALSEQEAEAVVRERINLLLDELTEREREIIRLYLDPEDLSLAEIARRTHRSRTTVEDVIDRFTERLRELLSSEGESPPE